MTDQKCCCECDECTHDATWRIYILKEFWGEYGQVCEPYCTHCLEEELEGIHTGGGLTSEVIDRIERIKPSEAAQLVREWHAPMKTLQKMIDIAIQHKDTQLADKLKEANAFDDADKINRWTGYYQKMGEDRGYWSLADVIGWVRAERAHRDH